MLKNIQNCKIILGSKSPRRQELMALLNLKFQVQNIDCEESYPSTLSDSIDIVIYLSQKKAKAYGDVSGNTILITADTLVEYQGQVLGKPTSLEEAKSMLRSLSGKTHLVRTGVSISTHNEIVSFADSSELTFANIEDCEIDYYLHNAPPLDKAGAYGIQEWIGAAFMENIKGSYNNVMGLPTHKLYEHLKNINIIL
ncbi:MAG: Maf family nucleotide pyrophosphatase [Bacteroidales bacterium]